MVASPLQPLAKVALVVSMALGSVMLWIGSPIGSPIGWLWIASQMQTDSKGAGFAPYLVVLVGIALTAVVLAIVMVISVSIGVVAMTIWFFFFAGSSLPT